MVAGVRFSASAIFVCPKLAAHLSITKALPKASPYTTAKFARCLFH